VGTLLSTIPTPQKQIDAGLFDRSELTRRFGALEAERDLWVPKWKEIRSYINPWLGEFKGESKTSRDYARKDEGIYDGVGYDAANVLAAGIMFGLTPRSRPWFKLGFEDAELSDWEPAKYYLDDATQILYTGFSRSNFYKSAHSLYAESGTFGTGAMGLWEDRNKMFRTKSFTIGTYALGTDAYGGVNQFCRRLTMNPCQMAQQFGYENLKKSTQQLVDRMDHKSAITVYHLIEPNTQTFDEAYLAQDLAYREYYWEESADKDQPLKVGGYHEFPIMAPRWINPNDGVYGYGPGWFALAESKGLQLLTEDFYVLVEMMLKPPLAATTSAHRSGINFFPGGVTIVEDANPNGAGVRPIMQVNPDLTGFLNQRQDSRQIIKRRFFADLFMMLDSLEKGQMTAREVIERSQEKMTMIGPSIENYQDEFLKPSIDRAFAIANRLGLLPPPPPELEGRELKVEFISPLSQAQKMSGLTGLEQGMAFIMNLAPMFPSVLKKVKPIEVVDRYWDALGVPAGNLNTDDEVKALEAAEQKQVQAQQMAAQFDQAAQVAKNLSSADMSGQNALTALVGTPAQGGLGGQQQ